jgi:hypothetical protein
MRAPYKYDDLLLCSLFKFAATSRMRPVATWLLDVGAERRNSSSSIGPAEASRSSAVTPAPFSKGGAHARDQSEAFLAQVLISEAKDWYLG